MARQKTGGRQKGSRNKRTQEREAATAAAMALIGGTIPDAFAGDAHAFLMSVYKNPEIDLHSRLDAAKAALPYEKPRLQAVTLANGGEEPLRVRSELEIGRRLAFVLELIARGEVKAKMPDQANRAVHTQQIQRATATSCHSESQSHIASLVRRRGRLIGPASFPPGSPHQHPPTALAPVDAAM
jgi:hypothetical protein